MYAPVVNRTAFVPVLPVIVSAVTVPSGAVCVLLLRVTPVIDQTALSNCSEYVSRLYRARRIGREADVACEAWLPKMDLTEMLSNIPVPLLVLLFAQPTMVEVPAAKK